MSRIIDFLKRNAIALAALFIALGGTSYAAVAIPNNSVGTRQLRPGAVTSSKIRSGAISAGKLSRVAFGGRIFALAEIEQNGSVVVSDPKDISTKMWTAGTSGIVVFPRSIPRSCVPLAGAASPVNLGPPTGASVPAVGAGFDSRTEVQLGLNGEFPVTLEILCGQ